MGITESKWIRIGSKNLSEQVWTDNFSDHLLSMWLSKFMLLYVPLDQPSEACKNVWSLRYLGFCNHLQHAVGELCRAKQDLKPILRNCFKKNMHCRFHCLLLLLWFKSICPSVLPSWWGTLLTGDHLAVQGGSLEPWHVTSPSLT